MKKYTDTHANVTKLEYLTQLILIFYRIFQCFLRTSLMEGVLIMRFALLAYLNVLSVSA